MPSVTTLIDDKVPLIKYDDTWEPGTSTDDPLADGYYLGTFTTNNVTNGAATWSFNGTAFWIYGSKRSNHGTYTVTVDGATYPHNDGNSAVNLFQQTLFNISGLTQGMHSLTITNTGTGSQYVDIDLIVWQSEVGGADDQLVTQTVQDTDPSFQYQAPAWNTNPPSVNFFNNGTGHSTSTYNASVTYTFTGDAISLYGTVGPQNGPYSVQLDGGGAETFNATAFMYYPQTMLYHADNLGSGSHQLLVTNLPAQNGQYLNIDYAQVYTLSSNSSTQPSNIDAASASSKIGAGPIAGIVISVIAAVSALIVAVIFYRRWRAAQIFIRHHDIYRIDSPQRHAGPASLISVRPTPLDTSEASLARLDPAPITGSTTSRSYQHSDYGYQHVQASQPQRPPPQGTWAIHNRATSDSDGTQDSRAPPSDISIIGSSLSPQRLSSNGELLNRRPLPTAPIPRSQEKAPQDGRTNDGLADGELPPPNYRQATSSTELFILAFIIPVYTTRETVYLRFNLHLE
ncbi:hypothetical protein SERLA73DRAFT_180711 [Serpula lacrymans var. lacrymans S7.3]|uniref:Transmembrane protein n=2 Tax=Serpula lacrymans var. lacrymans TaxID=341189 RepID=F8PW62_SERL3|nr:uncharacterized protein SERLADRAFT_466423 [Serpula lacrymans var. lacrymans S7.9]EGO00238.1 hypothetical protein SERLA73DRAFT_180711 [Serpula lacrymans var. lacrymans S7.3]EGO25795.1 hypothetical protein SERLADRAFT_466423 [Serpula lacrymans var. lacrymans S7.9]